MFTRGLALAVILMTAACSSAVKEPATAQADATPAKTAMVMASVPTSATGSGYVSAASLSPIADNFNTADGLQPTWGTGQLPGSMGVDPVGAFRMVCGAGQLSYDDPIVYPGQPGKSHLHQFYGNLGANAFSTYQSLR